MKGGTVQINWHDIKPVLTLDFHPISATLATGGADFEIKVLFSFFVLRMRNYSFSYSIFIIFLLFDLVSHDLCICGFNFNFRVVIVELSICLMEFSLCLATEKIK